MFSSTLKRSAATLGVVAGLLAAAVPASGQIGPATMGVKAPQAMHLEQISMGVKAPRANSSEIAMESLTQARGPANLSDIEAIDFNTLGTQVGSEGVMRNGRGFFDIPAELNTFGGNDTLRAPGGVVGVINELLDVKGPNAGTQIGIED